MKKILATLCLILGLVAALIGFPRFRHAQAVASEENFIRTKVTEIGMPRLRSDVEHLIRSHDAKKHDWVVPKENWPESFSLFRPVEVQIWGAQVFIVTSRHMQHRCGLVIGRRSDGGSVISSEIAEGFYYERT